MKKIFEKNNKELEFVSTDYSFSCYQYPDTAHIIKDILENLHVETHE